MKSLLSLLALGLVLGFIYWNTQHPDAEIDDIATGATGNIERVKTGIAAFVDAGDANGEGAEDGVVSDQSEISSRLASIEAELIETQNAIDPAATQSRIESLEAALVQNQQTTGDPSVVNGRLTDIEGKLALLTQRIDDQSQEFDSQSIDAALANLESSISSLQEAQQQSSDEQQASLAGMGERMSAFEARLNTLSSGASNGQEDTAATINAQIDQRIASLESKLNEAGSESARIESISNELSASQLKVQSLEQSVAQTNEQLVQLSRGMNSLQSGANSSSIDEQQEQIREQLAQLQSQMNQASVDSNVSELSSSLQATRDRIESLEQQVVNLPASSSAASDATEVQSALEAQIMALEKKLAEVASSDPAFADTLSQVEERVSELAAKSYVTQEDLRAQQQAKSVEYKILFERNSTAINAEAAAILDDFIAKETDRTIGVAIYGFTDRRGSAVYNQRLALQRATNVRSYLIQNGFSYTKISSLSGLGEDAAAAQLPDGEEDAEQRSVVLYARQP